MVDNGDNYTLERYLVGCDFGQAQDYTAITVIKQLMHIENGTIHYEIVALDRPPLGTQYNKIVSYIIDLLKSRTISGKTFNGCSIGINAPRSEPEIVVDATGCGRPIVDMLREAGVKSLGHLVAATITGGSNLTPNDIGYGVPKRDLATALQVLFQEGRIKIADGLEFGPILTQELLNVRVKINAKTGNDSFEAWRESDHDDMVLAVALACWWGDTYRKTPRIAVGTW
jgi:hypothetical protein